MKKSKKIRAGLKPQEYQHRVGVVIEALAAAVSGAQLLSVFLLAQEGVAWRDQGKRAAEAAREFRRACQWLKTIDRHG